MDVLISHVGGWLQNAITASTTTATEASFLAVQPGEVNKLVCSNGTSTSPSAQTPYNEEYSERLRQMTLRLHETERSLHSARQEVASYQDRLEQSKGQYIALDRKYEEAKQLLRESQQREADLLQREEFHHQLLQEDIELNPLVKYLKHRVIQLEQELQETQRSAGLPVHLPYDSTSTLHQIRPQLSRKHNQVLQEKQLVAELSENKIPNISHEDTDKTETVERKVLQVKQLEADLSENEIPNISPEDTNETDTVERKMPVKEELDHAVCPYELLHVSTLTAKADLAAIGGLVGRQLPSSTPIMASSSLSNSFSNILISKGISGASSNSSSVEREIGEAQRECENKERMSRAKKIAEKSHRRCKWWKKLCKCIFINK